MWAEPSKKSRHNKLFYIQNKTIFVFWVTETELH